MCIFGQISNMNWFGALQACLPYRVNVSGRKAKWIVSLGRTLAPNAKQVFINQQRISTAGHPLAQILQYAPVNFMRDFERSDLGHYMQAETKSGELFFDVGANLGGYSLLAKRLGMEVELFEPFPELAKFLAENTHAFGKVHPVALSDEAGELVFHISESNIGGSSLVDSSLGDAESGYSRDVKVKVGKGDEYVKGRVISILKIDVEGNEGKTVKGFEQSLRSGNIQRVWCEVRGPKSDRNANSYLEVLNFLSDCGYAAYTYKQGIKSRFEVGDANTLPQFFDLLFERA